MAETAREPRPHTVAIEGRGKITLGGIESVVSYDGNAIVAVSSEGDLIVRGENLHINSFDVKEGRLFVVGSLQSLEYLGRTAKEDTFFKRLFK